MSRANPKTTFLELPLNVAGHVALQNSVKRGFELIDAFAQAISAGTGLIASEITYDPGESNSAEAVTTVQGALDDIYNRLIRVEGRVDSNSQG